MFKKNPDGMRMEPTPERVLSLCRLIAQKSMTREDVRKSMSLNRNEDTLIGQINYTLDVALDNELSILSTKDDKLILSIDPNILSSIPTFRKYVATKAFSNPKSTFYMFTKWLISQNDRIFDMKTWEGIANTCGSEVPELKKLNENAVLGWRFWAAFLGIGYLSGTMIIPNMKLSIQDVLLSSFAEQFKYNEAIGAYDFIAWISNELPEVDMTDTLPLALSSGLRTLHELDLIKLETWQDSNRINLFYVDGDLINDFSHITVKEVIAK